MSSQIIAHINSSQMNEDIKDFYFCLGLLSTKFARLEYNILQLLGRLIVDDFILTNTILERNSLSQNIELLKKINKYRKFEEKAVSVLIEQISKIRVSRNLFIHGIWGEPFEKENDLMVICKEPKILYLENVHGRSWTNAKNHTFRLSYLKKQIQQVDDILLGQTHLMKRVEEFDD